MDSRRPLAIGYWALAIAAALTVWAAFTLAGSARSAQLSNCSQTVGGTAAAVSFPAAGSTGNPTPQAYLEICNAHATNNLGVNFVGGTASIGAAGTITLSPGGCLWWNVVPPIPSALSVIGSGAGTTTACGYQ